MRVNMHECFWEINNRLILWERDRLKPAAPCTGMHAAQLSTYSSVSPAAIHYQHHMYRYLMQCSDTASWSSKQDVDINYEVQAVQHPPSSLPLVTGTWLVCLKLYHSKRTQHAGGQHTVQ